MEARRLIKLAEHLESGKLAHKEFDFRQVTNNENVLPDDTKRTNVCGTAGCALGELPRVWPNRFKWTRGGIARRGKGFAQDHTFAAAEDFFDIDGDEASALFDPAYQLDRDQRELASLNSTSTAAEVAANIRLFVARKMAGRI